MILKLVFYIKNSTVLEFRRVSSMLIRNIGTKCLLFSTLKADHITIEKVYET